MQSVKNIIEKYGLADPVTTDTVGLFSNEIFQGLYDRLVTEGSESLSGALRVGATIEDLDISDLQQTLEYTDNQDIRTVYQNLMKGSRNHLRIFINRLSLLGITYKPQHLIPGGVRCDHQRRDGTGSGGCRRQFGKLRTTPQTWVSIGGGAGSVP